jgi:hypothetical protein
MTTESRAADLLQQRARLKTWAAASGSANAGAVVNDLAEIWAAARALAAAIESLSNDDSRASARRLIEVQEWLYEELLQHAASLKDPLQAAVDDAYARG